MPTEAGRRLIDRLRPALTEIAVAYEDVASDGEPGGRLKPDVPGVVARHILPSITAAFLAAHRRIRVEISVTERLVDVMAAGCVAGIRLPKLLGQTGVA